MDTQAKLTAVQIEGYEDNRLTSEQLENNQLAQMELDKAIRALQKEYQDKAKPLAEQLEALQLEAQRVNSEFSVREQKRRGQIDTLKELTNQE